MELTEEQARKLAVMVALHEGWQGWQQARVAVLLWAAALVDQGHLTVGQVGQALGVSQATYHRHVRALRPAPGSQLEADAALAVERALRAAGAGIDGHTSLGELKTAIKSNPDLELALLGVGVGLSRTEQE